MPCSGNVETTAWIESTGVSKTGVACLAGRGLGARALAGVLDGERAIALQFDAGISGRAARRG